MIIERVIETIITHRNMEITALLASDSFVIALPSSTPFNLLVPILFNFEEVSSLGNPTPDKGDAISELGDFIKLGEFNCDEDVELILSILLTYSNSIINRNNIYSIYHTHFITI